MAFGDVSVLSLELVFSSEGGGLRNAGFGDVTVRMRGTALVRLAGAFTMGLTS